MTSLHQQSVDIHNYNTGSTTRKALGGSDIFYVGAYAGGGKLGEVLDGLLRDLEIPASNTVKTGGSRSLDDDCELPVPGGDMQSTFDHGDGPIIVTRENSAHYSSPDTSLIVVATGGKYEQRRNIPTHGAVEQVPYSRVRSFIVEYINSIKQCE